MARRNVSIFINGKQVEKQIKSIAAEKRKIVNELKLMTVGSKEYNDKMKELDKINPILDKHKKRIRGTETTWSKITTAAKGFLVAQVAAFTAEALVDYGKELFRLGSEMELLGKKAQTVFGEALPIVTRMAEENAAAMGLTISQYTDAATKIGDLLIPMGFQREEAASISTNLVNLSGALSEWTGGQVSATEVTDILGKAMLGEREQLKGLGIAISEADVKNRLAEKGLSNLTGEMLQQAKAAATLELITEKSADAQTAFAENSDTLVRKQAVLSARFETIKEQMATALIPVFHRLFEAVAPVVEGAADLATALLGSEEAASEVSPTMRVVATVLRNVGNAIGFLFGGLKAIAKYMLNNFGGAIEFVGVKLAEVQNSIFGFLNSIAEATGIESRFELINIDDLKAGLADAKKALNDSGIKEEVTIPIKPKLDKNAILQEASKNAELEKAREKAAEKEEKQLEKRLERLKGIRDKFNEESRLAELSEEDRKIAELSAKFDVQIKEAMALEAKGLKDAREQRIELERLKEEALDALREELIEKSNEQFDEDMQKLAEQQDAETVLELEKLAEREEEKQELLKEQESILKELQVAKDDEELLELEQKLQLNTAMLEEHNVDSLDALIRFRKSKAAANDRFDKEEDEKLLKQQQKRLKKQAEFYSKIAGVIGSTIDILGEKAAEHTALGKTLALAQIAFSTASAIASGTAVAVKAGPFPANLAAIATTVATVLANVASAKKIISAQKKHGGWHNVVGPDDGLNYRAKYIGSPSSGMLPSHPVVLASEGGKPEYFVSHRDLQNPYVLDHVRAIENVRGQYKDGGATAELPGASTEPRQEQDDINRDIQLMTLQVLQDLSSKIDNMKAEITDETALAISDKVKELSAASGGTLG